MFLDGAYRWDTLWLYKGLLLFVLRFNVQVMSGRSHRFLYVSGSKVSCSRTQHGGGRLRPFAPESDALTLSHRAPHKGLCINERTRKLHSCTAYETKLDSRFSHNMDYFEPRHVKNCLLHMRKQRRRSAAR